jgi:hypothetical protein
MANDYKYYLQGSLYFLANDSQMPESTRRDTKLYGYCKEEYEEFNNFPPQLYVRISNRVSFFFRFAQIQIMVATVDWSNNTDSK